MRVRVGLVVLVVCASMACQDRRSPVGPTMPESSNGTPSPRLAQEVRQQWSPYVGVQVTGEALETYRDALARLARSGQLKGVRAEIRKSDPAGGARVIKAIASLGLELLGLIGNEYLFDQDIERVIRRPPRFE